MDQQTVTKFINSEFVKKATQLLLSVYVFSFLFSYASWFSSSFHSLTNFQLLSHMMDKNCIFLIFNGILVFIAKTSGLISSSPACDHSNQLLFKRPEPDTDSFLEKEISIDRAEPLEGSLPEEEKEKSDEDLVKEEQEAQVGGINNPSVEDEESDQKEMVIDGVFRIQEEEEEEGNGFMSTEELNRKFDEFIRKMKEEIRIGAQQQVVMVQQ
ncbi:uncharacterized protein LOC127811966 [Diospyros lotus]|uniref:uncharacterized protein LOC127811966 n=1 Tax=Diospyros lotus TaxID=55363 RepID=UPI0022521CA9|nr:uncharacterized protein LOC127811966 [Diospyros lotus]